MKIALPHPLYVFVIDHRRQWIQWCDEHGVDRLRIREIKRLAADAFLLARRDSVHAMKSGVLLVDRQFGAEAFVRARAGGAIVGTPAERDGAFPLEWIDRFDKTLRGEFAKVLVRHADDIAAELFESQLASLLELHQWCSTVGKPLVVEVLTSTRIDATIRHQPSPDLLAEYIRLAYSRGIVPEYWAIEGSSDPAAMRTVEEAIRERERPKLLIVADGSAHDAFAPGFESTRGLARAAGIAVGNTVYGEPTCEFLLGRLAADDAVHAMASNYRSVIDRWRRTEPPRFS